MMGLWAISGWKWKSPSLNWLWFFVTPWTVAHQLPLSVGFSRQEYWSGKSFPSPGDLPNPGIEPRSLELQADSLSKWQSSDNVSLPPPSPKIETQKVKVNSLSRVRLFATPWTVAYQAPPSMAFSRQEYWSGLPFPSPGDLPYPRIKPRSPAFQADALTSEPETQKAKRKFTFNFLSALNSCDTQRCCSSFSVLRQ